MTKRIFYEWVIRTVETDSEEADIDHSDVFPSNASRGLPEKYHVEIELKKDVCYWDSDVTKQEVDSGLVAPDIEHNYYAQFRNGKLEEFFEDGERVPKRFHKEIEKEQG
tara:strand:+ start:136 stop:462 length:327 start_codon:yes stop_codon:yes gene_type:complete